MKIEIRQGFITSTVAALTVGLFLFDVLTPRGLTTQVLYVIPLLLSFLSANTTLPLAVASVCSLLILAGLYLSPEVFNIPSWVIASNRLFSLVIIWTPVLYFHQRRRHEEQLTRMNEELEHRVQERTKDLASVNQALVTEVSERMHTERMLDASRHELRSLAAELLRVQEDERRRISRDLHDDINQRLALLAVELEAIERPLPMASQQLGQAIRSVQDRVVELSEDVRHLAYQLHPSILDDLGLPIALQRLVDDFTARTGIIGRFVNRGVSKSLPQDIATCLYRVAQESLGNIARHAQASTMSVELTGTKDTLTIVVGDDGVGFDPHHVRSGLGLLSMKERIALVNGSLDITSTVGKGTLVCVRVPQFDEDL
jgi:signal transduction histidine kinase